MFRAAYCSNVIDLVWNRSFTIVVAVSVTGFLFLHHFYHFEIRFAGYLQKVNACRNIGKINFTFGSTAFYKLPPNLTIDALIRSPILATGQQVFPIYDDEKLLGFVDIGQINKIPKSKWESTPLASIILTPDNMVKANLHDSVFSVLQQFSQINVNQIPIFDEDRFVGLASRQRIINLIQMRTRLKL